MDVSGVLSVPEEPATVPSALLGVESRLREWRRAVRTRLGSDYPSSIVDPGVLTAALSGGPPLVTSLDPLPKPSLLSDATSAFLDVVAEVLPASQSLGRWLRELSSHPSRRHLEARWFSASWRVDQDEMEGLAADSGVGAEVLAWAGDRIAGPFFGRLGELLKPHLASDPEGLSSACPCCGRGPRMGRYRSEDGRRFLWCSLCDLQWGFRRLTCPFCANSDPDTLGYLTVQGAAGWRIDVCGRCGAYLRAADERGLPEGGTVDLALAEVATLLLCVAAENAGYGSPVDMSSTS